ncbi:hypothetical protein BBJ28_00023420 [Nothophytophthora sp. Chile5]|nr:hypothetical protein BBJ28_00023420 [Nothophytophthora sp. Chile5]
MATIYRGSPSPSRFPFSTHAHTHYTTNADPAAQIQMQMRYNSYVMDGQLSASPPSSSPRGSMGMTGPPSPILATPPPGATLGLLGDLKQQQMYVSSSTMRHSSAMYSNQNASALYMQSMMNKMYQPHPPVSMMQQSELLLVSPGVPTPLELSIYENKQPTGFLHVTVGNQTVEFLDGVANMPQKR